MTELKIMGGYTPKQVADLLGYRVSSIYAMLSRQEMQASKIGRNRVISQTQLNDFLQKKKVTDAIIDYTK